VLRVQKLERGREPGKPAADDHCLHSVATARTLAAAERCGRSLKTS
jgi:hypothetical protein